MLPTPTTKARSLRRLALAAGASAILLPLHAKDSTWWNPAWPQFQEITIDTGADAAATSESISDATVLVRLHDGNFQFLNAADDGSDLRFVAADGKTLLSHHVEKYDNLLNEAFVWVKIPEIKANGQTGIRLYYGSVDPSSAPAKSPADAYDGDTDFVHHFSGSATDATSNGYNAEGPASIADGSLIGGGLRLPGTAPVLIDAPDWSENPAFTLSFWVRPAAPQPGAVILSRGDGAESFKVLLDSGVPSVEIQASAVPVRVAAEAALPDASWSHLAVVSENGTVTLYVNGTQTAQAVTTVPALSGPFSLGGTDAGFSGEIDEFQLSSVARTPDFLKFAAINQGTSDSAARTLFLGELQSSGGGAGGHSEMLEHVMLFGDIAGNMMFDGWIAIGVCVIMIIVGWSVAAQKFLYLNSIQKGTGEFLHLWKRLSSDLTAIDHADDNSVRSFGGNADPETIELVEKSPLYQIYHIGSEEIKHRLERDKHRTKGLSGRSIQAIRAALDAGLVRATHKLTNGLVYLTISIAGGPYVGLLGTVVGVMITFAIIAKSGEVDVNSIAPGIASALLATVAGLVVAIPALFIYSYLNGRIKNITAEMHVFIDEFVAKMAEFYPPEGESSPYASGGEHRTSNVQH